MSAPLPDSSQERPALPEPLVKKRTPLFLERRSYRQRRLLDALRLLPVLGALLWAVPLLWQDGSIPTSRAILYVFGVWLGLVLLAATLTSRLKGRSENDTPSSDSNEAERDIWQP